MCLDYGYFTYKGVVYQQKNGVAMGDPVSSIVADIVMDEIFRLISEKFNNFNLKLLLNYVDDSLLFIKKDCIDDLLTFVNSINENLKFTVKCMTNNRLPFLDIEICDYRNHYITNYYNKRIASGRFLNYFSYTEHIYKINCLKNLIHRHLFLSDNFFLHRAN